MGKRRFAHAVLVAGVLSVFIFGPLAHGLSEAFKENIYKVGILKPIDSVLKVKVGNKAPDFILPSISGEKISLSPYQGRKNVVLSFVPAAWTPVCSDQWPGYNIIQDIFNQNHSILLGITVDNIPTLFAWTHQMGKLWFPVLSDFWPHGAVAKNMAYCAPTGFPKEPCLSSIKKGIIRYIDVHDINKRPPLEDLVNALEKINR